MSCCAQSHRHRGALQQESSKFVEAELLYQRGLLPQATYLFKHALSAGDGLSIATEEQTPGSITSR